MRCNIAECDCVYDVEPLGLAQVLLDPQQACIVRHGAAFATDRYVLLDLGRAHIQDTGLEPGIYDLTTDPPDRWAEMTPTLAQKITDLHAAAIGRTGPLPAPIIWSDWTHRNARIGYTHNGDLIAADHTWITRHGPRYQLHAAPGLPATGIHRPSRRRAVTLLITFCGVPCGLLCPIAITDHTPVHHLLGQLAPAAPAGPTAEPTQGLLA